MKTLRSSIMSHLREEARQTASNGTLKGQKARKMEGLVKLNQLIANSERALSKKVA